MRTAEDTVAYVNRMSDEHGWPMLCTTVSGYKTPKLRGLQEVWEAKRGMRTMPCRSDLTLRDIKFAASNVGFVRATREGDKRRYKILLMGGELEQFITPMSGQFVDDAVPHHFAQKWTIIWDASLDARVPLRTLGRLEFNDRRLCIVESLVAPLAHDGETPDGLITAVYFHMLDNPRPHQAAICQELKQELGETIAREGLAWSDA
jgi:hypothetical protein